MKGIPKVPYFQTSRYRVATMVELAQPREGDIGIDLGSGDGRIVVAFAKVTFDATKVGVDMHGYEIDDTLRNKSLELIKQQGLSNAYIHNKDFWTEDLSRYTIVCCYPMPTIMGRLERKLQTELHPGARVVLNYFPFRHWKSVATKDNIYLYRK